MTNIAKDVLSRVDEVARDCMEKEHGGGEHEGGDSAHAHRGCKCGELEVGHCPQSRLPGSACNLSGC